MSNTREVRTAKQAEEEDVFFGQTVIMWARWSVIVAGIALVLWTSTNVALLTQTMPFFLVLMAVNFFLHGRFVMGSPLNRTVVTVASVIDIVLITGMFKPRPPLPPRSGVAPPRVDHTHLGVCRRLGVLPRIPALALDVPPDSGADEHEKKDERDLLEAIDRDQIPVDALVARGALLFSHSDETAYSIHTEGTSAEC